MNLSILFSDLRRSFGCFWCVLIIFSVFLPFIGIFSYIFSLLEARKIFFPRISGFSMELQDTILFHFVFFLAMIFRSQLLRSFELESEVAKTYILIAVNNLNTIRIGIILLCFFFHLNELNTYEHFTLTLTFYESFGTTSTHLLRHFLSTDTPS